MKFHKYTTTKLLISNLGYWLLKISSTNPPKYGYFEPKSINFLIFTKFSKYIISEVLISNLTCFQKFRDQIPKFGHFGSKLFNLKEIFSCTLFRKCWFQIWHSFSVLLSSLISKLHEPIQCLHFTTYCFWKSLKML